MKYSPFSQLTVNLTAATLQEERSAYGLAKDDEMNLFMKEFAE
jgi:hypothetical protein